MEGKVSHLHNIANASKWSHGFSIKGVSKQDWHLQKLK